MPRSDEDLHGAQPVSDVMTIAGLVKPAPEKDDDEAEAATWTPDGRRIVYATLRGGRRDFYSRPADGSSAEEPFVSTDRHLHSGSWMPDGQSLLAVAPNGPDTGTFWLLREKPTPSARLLMKSTCPQARCYLPTDDGSRTSNETKVRDLRPGVSGTGSEVSGLVRRRNRAAMVARDAICSFGTRTT
jgi:hypothetical protein